MLKKMFLLIILLAATACLAWTCPECGTGNDDSAKYCTYCGAEKPKVKYCPECGAEFPEGARFCPDCGFDTLGETTAATTAVSTADTSGRWTKDLGDFVIIPRVGFTGDFAGDFGAFSFGGQVGYNLGGVNGDMTIAIDFSTGADVWDEGEYQGETNLMAFFLGTQGYLGTGTIRFTWGGYLGFAGVEVKETHTGYPGDEIDEEWVGFTLRQRLGVAIMFSRNFGLEIGVAIDELFAANTILTYFPAAGLIATF